MKQIQFRILGTEVFSLVLFSGDAAEEYEEGISGGSAQNFERDDNPPDPMGEEPWDDAFGFRR